MVCMLHMLQGRPSSSVCGKRQGYIKHKEAKRMVSVQAKMCAHQHIRGEASVPRLACAGMPGTHGEVLYLCGGKVPHAPAVGCVTTRHVHAKK